MVHVLKALKPAHTLIYHDMLCLRPFTHNLKRVSLMPEMLGWLWHSRPFRLICLSSSLSPTSYPLACSTDPSPISGSTLVKLISVPTSWGLWEDEITYCGKEPQIVSNTWYLFKKCELSRIKLPSPYIFVILKQGNVLSFLSRTFPHL